MGIGLLRLAWLSCLGLRLRDVVPRAETQGLQPCHFFSDTGKPAVAASAGMVAVAAAAVFLEHSNRGTDAYSKVIRFLRTRNHTAAARG